MHGELDPRIFPDDGELQRIVAHASRPVLSVYKPCERSTDTSTHGDCDDTNPSSAASALSGWWLALGALVMLRRRDGAPAPYATGR